MIRYSLACQNDHRFDSWFQTGDAFERLTALGQVICPACGSARVQKSMMTPSVVTQPDKRARNPGPSDVPAQPHDTPKPRPLAEPASEVEKALAQLRREVEANSEYVGLNFAQQARAIHDGDAPSRAIYGEARPEEARQLIEDGVPVAPLPFIPLRKTN